MFPATAYDHSIENLVVVVVVISAIWGSRSVTRTSTP